MNRSILVLLGAILLAGCNQSQPPASAPVPQAPLPAVAAPEPPKPVAATDGDTGMEILLQRSIEVPFQHEINYDIKDVSKNGTPRRRVLLEVLDPDFAKATSDFTSALEVTGYVMASEEIAPGKQQRTYVKEGGPTYYLLIQEAAVGPKLNNPDAVGSVHMMWNER